MEDAVKALYIVFAMMVLVIALSASMNLFTQAKQTADTIIFTIDESNYYDNLNASSSNIKRQVGIETVIPTLYRYYKENFLVRIIDENGNEIQVFDTELETAVRTAANANMTKVLNDKNNAIGTQNEEPTLQKYLTYKAHRLLYNDPAKDPYMFGAPWIGSTTEDARARIDYFLYGKVGYINGTKLDYSATAVDFLNSEESFFEKYKDATFEETFIEYEYTGQAMTSEDGQVTLEEQDVKTKIQITYRVTHVR